MAGEGILCWWIQDATGIVVHVEIIGYHVPNADVHLLSPQVLLKTLGGHALQTIEGIDIILENGIDLCAPQYGPCSNLPIIPLALVHNTKYCFWSDAFGYLANGYNVINAIKSVMNCNNTYLSSSQMEFLCISCWVQTLMQDQKWLPDILHTIKALHSGLFIAIKSSTCSYNVPDLKCTVCLFATASTRTVTNMALFLLYPRLPSTYIWKGMHWVYMLKLFCQPCKL